MRGWMSVVGWIGLALASAGVTGCNPLPVTVAARLLAPLPVGEIRRIAVLPFTTAGLVRTNDDEPGMEPLPEPPGDTVTRAVLSTMQRFPAWQLVDELTVGEALRRLYREVRPPTPSEAQAVGTFVRADAVLRGEVKVFEERIGSELAAKRPAHVVFAVELLRMPSGTVVWQAEYAEQQRSLSENLWNLPGFFRAGGKWVRAGELAQIGAEQVAARLHEALYGPPPKRRSGRAR